MNAYKQSSVWIYRMVIVFGLIVIGSLIVIITMTMMERSIPGIIAILGLASMAGLVRLLISPLN